MTDQQRADSLGCYGGRAVPTPALDRLAAQGTRFDRCTVNATICTPSRASIMTGRPVPGHGVYKLHDNLPPDQVLFPRLLQRAGYATALIGKLHVSGRVTEAQRRHVGDGFDTYQWCMDPAIHLDSPLNAYAAWLAERHPAFLERLEREGKKVRNHPAEAHFTRWAADRTIAFLRGRDRSRPFFCKMSLFDPHDPFDDYPLECGSLVNTSLLPDPIAVAETSAPIPSGIRRERERLACPATREQLDPIRLGYHASIGFLDREIGRVLAVLDEERLTDDTLVIFVSDHGESMGDRGLLTKGAWFYEECVRVPLIMRFPGRLASGRAVDALVQPHDLAATVLAAAGVDPVEWAALMPHSRDLLAVARGEAPGRDHAVSVYRNTGYGPGGRYFEPPIHATMFRDRRWKLNVYHDVGMGAAEPEGELYDLDADPREQRNLWADRRCAGVRTHLASRLMDWMVDMDRTYTGTRGGEAVTFQVG